MSSKANVVCSNWANLQAQLSLQRWPISEHHKVQLRKVLGMSFVFQVFIREPVGRVEALKGLWHCKKSYMVMIITAVHPVGSMTIRSRFMAIDPFVFKIILLISRQDPFSGY